MSTQPALLPRPLFHVVLHEPEIPNNTGNIGRTCVATRCALHLIHPLGFDTSEKACRRAGLDYWPRLSVAHHESFGAFRAAFGGGGGGGGGGAGGGVGSGDEVAGQGRRPRIWAFTTHATRSVFEAEFRAGDALVFGKESRGLPREVVDEVAVADGGGAVVLPMAADERSLNLATAVCAAVYEGVRQLLARGEVGLDGRGRLV